MSLINNNGKASAKVFMSNFIEDKRKLLHRGNYYLFAVFYEFAQVPGVFRMTHRSLHLRKLLDSSANLLVEDTSVSHDNDRIENSRIVFAKSN